MRRIASIIDRSILRTSQLREDAYEDGRDNTFIETSAMDNLTESSLLHSIYIHCEQMKDGLCIYTAFHDSLIIDTLDFVRLKALLKEYLSLCDEIRAHTASPQLIHVELRVISNFPSIVSKNPRSCGGRRSLADFGSKQQHYRPTYRDPSPFLINHTLQLFEHVFSHPTGIFSSKMLELNVVV